MKWLLIFCLLAVHHVNAMPNKEEEEVYDSIEEMAPESRGELQKEESNSVNKRDAEFDAAEKEEDEEKLVNRRRKRNIKPRAQEEEEEEEEDQNVNSRNKRDAGPDNGDGSSEENLDVDVNVNINAPQPNLKADVDVNVNINAAPDPSGSLSCSPGWILFEGSCYYFSTDRGTWFPSRQKCLDMGGDLVKITTDSEFYFLQARVTDHTWIGLTDKDEEGVYRWVSDNSVHDAQAHRNWWLDNQPDDYGTAEVTEDFGHFLYNYVLGIYVLNDVVDSWMSLYICEKMPTETSA